MICRILRMICPIGGYYPSDLMVWSIELYNMISLFFDFIWFAGKFQAHMIYLIIKRWVWSVRSYGNLIYHMSFFEWLSYSNEPCLFPRMIRWIIRVIRRILGYDPTNHRDPNGSYRVSVEKMIPRNAPQIRVFYHLHCILRCLNYRHT